MLDAAYFSFPLGYSVRVFVSWMQFSCLSVLDAGLSFCVGCKMQCLFRSVLDIALVSFCVENKKPKHETSTLYCDTLQSACISVKV